MDKKIKVIITEALSLANHVDGFKDDTYLVGHTGWLEITKEASQFLRSVKDSEIDLR